MYGSTELGVDTVLAPRDQRRKPGSCGRAAPGVEIRLFDDDGHEVTTPDTPGEVYVRSANNFATYHKAPDKFDANRRGDFLSVGDIAYRDDEGFYYICDRKSDMIISGGMNVYPAEIEAALERHPAVQEVAVFGIPSDEWGETVHAVVVARPGATLDAGRADRVRAPAPRRVQGAALDGVRGRAAQDGLRQDPQARRCASRSGAGGPSGSSPMICSRPGRRERDDA